MRSNERRRARPSRDPVMSHPSLRFLLSLGTCFTLVLPAPAYAFGEASPDSLRQSWGDRPVRKPAGPAASSGAEPRATRPATEDPAATSTRPAAANSAATSTRPATSSAGRAAEAAALEATPRRTPKKRFTPEQAQEPAPLAVAREPAPEPEPEPPPPEPIADPPPEPAPLDRAAAERAPIEELARAQARAGALADAARTLGVGAAAYHDPLLHLAAADAHLALAHRRGRAGRDDADRCIAHAREAQRLLADDARVPPGQRDELSARAERLLRDAARHRDTRTERRSGRGLLLAGSVLTGTGLVGVGVMARGLAVNKISDRELAREGAWTDAQLAPLHAQKERGETMLAAGAVAGAMGLALGVALLAAGARNLRAARSLRAAPTLGGLVLVGRF